MDQNKAKKILLDCKGKNLSLEEKIQRSIEFASALLEMAEEKRGIHDRQFQKELAAMVKDPIGQAFTAEVADQIFRSSSPLRVADQLRFIIKKYGIPKFLSMPKKWGLYFFQFFSNAFPGLFASFAQKMMRKKSANVILPGEREDLQKYLKARKNEGVVVNLNRIGEAILGEEEAAHRLKMYLEDLNHPEITYISVKISSIYSQINLVAQKETLASLSEKLKTLYRAAKGKFVNLDMEEYRDLHLTVELFKSVLDDPEFFETKAGIVLQSYLPDSFSLQKELTEWAKARVLRGGAPIKIRLVKGANLAMEKVEASLKSWPLAPYSSKRETDANYIKMIDYALQEDNVKAVHIGIGSHNLLDIAYALIGRSEKNAEEFVTCEMLEGMAEGMRQAVQEVAEGMLLYAPIVKKEQFQNAISYLVRRLDENTAKGNFLRDSFSLKVGSQEWESQVERFILSCHEKDSVSHESNRQKKPKVMETGMFTNEPDTDWSVKGSSEQAISSIKKWQEEKFMQLPVVIRGENIIRKDASAKDPSLPSRDFYTYTEATLEELHEAIQASQIAQKQWEQVPIQDKSLLLKTVAEGLRKNRMNLIGVMCADTAKTALESDPEISEAIDFAEYYRRMIAEYQLLTDIHWKAKGVILVAPPWNFSCSIPAGGILAALATGNSVLFKPAPEAILVGYELVNIFWEAGIPKDVLQFIPCRDDPEGSSLIQDTRVAAVILTGATATAKLFHNLRPDLDLIAETGGKNAIIVTAMADRDLAIKDIVQSAFGYSGQKCSACSLLILEKEVYEDQNFLNALKDAAKSLKVGIPYDASTKINPLIKPPEKALLRGLSTLDSGEKWLLEPKQDPINPFLWSPGVKLGVKEGSFTHQTELFGPLLAVLCADNLDHAIHIANSTKYGLTSGIHSLDTREQQKWMSKIVTGNAYINRGITGAIVERQPFGGCKESSFGKGAKAGGPNYLLQLMHAEQNGIPYGDLPLPKNSKNELMKHGKIFEKLEPILCNYFYYYKYYFSKEHDPLKILGQDNLLKYVPHREIILRVEEPDSIEDVFKVFGACLITKTPLKISSAKKLENLFFHLQTEDEFIQTTTGGSRLRFLSQPSLKTFQALSQASCHFHIGPVLDNGRLELLHYLREVVFSIDYHRYGYLGLRENDSCPMVAQCCGACTVC